ncbi:hypothetical protein RBB50_012458 [Rhinocladiella similis]
MREFGPAPLPQEPSNRESGVLPANYAVQEDQWQWLQNEIVDNDGLRQLVVLLAHCTVPYPIYWNTAVLSDIASPRSPRQNERLAALSKLQRIAKLDPLDPIANLEFTREELQGFMYPILTSGYSPRQDASLEDQKRLESAPIVMIASELEKLGCPLDQKMLLARRRQLLTTLRRHPIQSGRICLFISIPELEKYSRLRRDVEAELGSLVDSPLMEEIVPIVVLSRCGGLAYFLNVWSQLSEAEGLMSQVHTEFHKDLSHGSKKDIHTRKLLLLVAGYEIQRHFQAGAQTVDGTYLPSSLSWEGPCQYGRAAYWYAQIYSLQFALSIFSPSLSAKPKALQEIEWKDYFMQHFPSNWSSYNAPGVTFSSNTSNQGTFAEEKSYFDDDDDDGYTTWPSAMLTWITGCLRFRK